MDPPSLIVLPPTPLHPSSSQPHSTISTPTPSTPSDLPDLSPSAIDRERSSTETTIVTIYSMYEEDERSWSASDSAAGHRHRPPTKELDVAIAGVQAYRESYLQANGAALEDSTFYDSSFGLHRSSSPAMRLSLTDKSRTSVLSTESAHLAYAESRPSSSNGVTHPVSVSQDRDDSQPAHRDQPARHSLHASVDRSSKPHSRPTSRHRKSLSSSTSHTSNGIANGVSPARLVDKDKVLPSIPASPSVASSSTASPAPRQESIPPPSRTPVGSPPLSSAHSSLRAYLTPPSSPRIRSSGTPSSKHSITPSEGEDPDAFHVRSTYAQLEVCGVRGDGYDEGVERTRARVGGNRASELRAEQALADEHEKTRDLTQQEINLLASLDR